MTTSPDRPSPGGSATRVMMLWCPGWPVRAAACDADPLILVARGKVVACSDSAGEQGVSPGQRIREAQLRCPEATVRPHDPLQEERAFASVLRAIESVVPGVHPVRPGLAAVRAQGARRFYGSEHLAAQALLHRVHDHTGTDARVAVADGLFAAEHAAYTTSAESPLAMIHPGDSKVFLDRLPVEVLTDQLSESTRMPMLLRRMGIRHLADLARLRRAEVHSRFGSDGLRAHRLSCGEDVEMFRPRQAPQDLSVRVDLEEGAIIAEHVLAQCAEQIAEFVQALTRQSLVCHEIQLTVTTFAGATHTRRWRHPWHFETTDLLDRLSWQLRDVEGSGSDGVAQVCLEPTEIASAAGGAVSLWGDRPDDRVKQALAGLQKALGHRGVLASAVAGGRLLDERRVLRPWGDALPSPRERRLDQPWPGTLPGPPPATVFTDPAPVEVLTAAEQPAYVTPRGEVSGAPALLRIPGGIGRGGRITAWAGPWPVQQRWWRAPSSRLDRLQLVDERHQAWLVLSEAGHWRAEARYD